jgi:hypothetical protein
LPVRLRHQGERHEVHHLLAEFFARGRLDLVALHGERGAEFSDEATSESVMFAAVC